MKDKQQHLSAGDSLFTCVRWPRAKQPRRAVALENLERLLPWDQLEKIVRPFFSADTQRSGRPGYSLKMLIRSYVVQYFWTLSDDALEGFILDSHAACRFIGSDPWQPRPPSATRMRNFRRLLEQNALEVKISVAIMDACYLAEVQVRRGQCIEPIFRRQSMG